MVNFYDKMVSLSGVVNKIETRQTAVIRNDTLLPYIHVLYCVLYGAYLEYVIFISVSGDIHRYVWLPHLFKILKNLICVIHKN